MLVTFIVPAFNASATIERCLKSIYALPLDESVFEVIVIDDCSTDNTDEMVKEFACNHSNLVLIRQEENHRQGAARNRGVAMANGKYIVFVDSDDEIAKGVIIAVQLAEENDLNMVAMRYARVGVEGKNGEDGCLPYSQTKLFAGTDLQTEFPFWGTALWPYIYRKDFLDEVNYPFAEDVLFEDSDFVNVHLYHAKRMSYCDEYGYIAHYNANSTTHTLSYKHLCDYALLGTRMLGFYNNIEDKTTKYSESILEGGSFNIWKAFRKLVLLNSVSEVRAFYDRFDSQFDRRILLDYKKPGYCWTKWTRVGLKHKRLCVFLLGIAIPLKKAIRK